MKIIHKIFNRFTEVRTSFNILIKKDFQFTGSKILYLVTSFFDVCTICEECQFAEILGRDASDLADWQKKRRKPRSVDPEPMEPRPCKPDLDHQDQDTDTFESERSKFNGYQISSNWIPKSFTPNSCNQKRTILP